jgi:hypothetical protein
MSSAIEAELKYLKSELAFLRRESSCAEAWRRAEAAEADVERLRGALREACREWEAWIDDADDPECCAPDREALARARAALAQQDEGDKP